MTKIKLKHHANDCLLLQRKIRNEIIILWCFNFPYLASLFDVGFLKTDRDVEELVEIENAQDKKHVFRFNRRRIRFSEMTVIYPLCIEHDRFTKFISVHFLRASKLLI